MVINRSGRLRELNKRIIRSECELLRDSEVKDDEGDAGSTEG